VLANDTDVDNSNAELSVSSFTQAAHGTVSQNADGSFTYSPDADFNGTDSFTYKATDGTADSNAATVTLTVDPVNDAPEAANDGKQVNEDNALTFPATDLVANDSSGPADENGQNLSVMAAGSAVNGTVGLDSGDITFDPNANYNGLASFEYTVCDDGKPQQCDTGTVNVSVNAVNDAPVLDLNGDNSGVDYNATFTEDGEKVGIVGASDPGGLTVADVDDTNMETATATLTNHPDGAAETLSVDTTGTSITATSYNPTTGVLGLSGSASKVEYEQVLRTVRYDNASQNPSTADRIVEFVVNDGDLDSARPNSTVAVISVNDAPDADSQAVTAIEDTTSKLVTLSAADDDNDSLTYKVTILPARGKLYRDESTDAADEIKSADLPAGLGGTNQVTYVPDLNYNGPDSFEFVANDGTVDSDEATVSITVNAVNDAPVASGDSYSVNEDNALNIAAPGVLGNDTDVENHQLAAVLETAATHGSVTLNANGSFAYTPDEDYNGSDSFTYRADDGGLASNAATVAITVNAVNDPPVAEDDLADTDEDTAAVINVLADDSDVDGDALGVASNSLSDPANGSVEVITSGDDQGKVLYTPDAHYNGPDSFTYRVSDGIASSDPATVGVNVRAINDAPKAEADSYETDEDAQLTINDLNGVLSNDSDRESEILQAELISGPTNGQLTLNADGSFTYTPNANFSGTDSFTYKAIDSSNGEASATVTVTIRAVNDAPVAANDTYSVNEDSTLNIAVPGVLGNDTDIDSANLTAILAEDTDHGQLTLNADGSFAYMPSANYSGPDSFTYRASDGAADSAAATVSININPVNDAPTISDVTDQVTNEDVPTGAISFTVEDVDTPANSLSVTGSSDNQALVPNSGIAFAGTGANRTLTITPASGQSGTATITVSVSDDGGQIVADTFVLTVNAVDGVLPTVTTAVPGGKKVSPKAMVTAKFSEPMDEASVEAPGVFTLKKGTKKVQATITYNPATQTATLDPTKNLLKGATYTATVLNGPSGAKDLASNGLAALKVWKFKIKR
jgi:VCBS repeat-containing protein